jgi:hypothetical protein
MSQSILGWMKVSPPYSDLAENELSDKKVANPFAGN